MMKQDGTDDELKMRARMIQRQIKLENDAGIMQAVVFVSLWLIVVAAVICYAAWCK